jgi:hypothetical protein
MLNFDQFARAAIEVGRSSYNPLPTASSQEYAWFFSRRNYDYLYRKARELARNEPDSGELFEAMLKAYSMIQPRGDEMDERRELEGPDITQSYVDELNKYVLEQVVPDIKAANQLWSFWAKYRNGPVDMQDDEYYIDTRSRFQGSRIDASYLLP